MAMLDTGSNITLIDSNLVRRLKLCSTKTPINIKLLKSQTRSLGCVNLNLTIGNQTKVVQAHIIDDMAHGLLIGIDEAGMFDLNISTKLKVVTQEDRSIPVTFPVKDQRS